MNFFLKKDEFYEEFLKNLKNPQKVIPTTNISSIERKPGQYGKRKKKRH